MPYLYLSLAALFWGGNYVVGKLMVANVDPVLLSQARWLLTSLLLVIINYRPLTQSLHNIRQSWKTLTMLAICGQVLFPLTLYIGLQYTTSLNAAIYLSATPCLVLSINRFVFGDAVSRANWLGVAASTLGVAWLVTMGDLSNLHFLQHFNKGDLWTLLSAASWALYCAFLRTKPKTVPAGVFVTYSALVGTVLLIPFSVATVYLTPNALPALLNGTISGWGLAYLVIFPSWLAYLFWSRGIAELGATRGEIFTHLVPLSGGALSVVFLGTPLHAYHWVSLALIASGVVICAVKPKATAYRDTSSPAT